MLIGRPYAYGLALAGEEGVREVIANFVADFDLTMGLAGCRSVREIGPGLADPRPGLTGRASGTRLLACGS